MAANMPYARMLDVSDSLSPQIMQDPNITMREATYQIEQDVNTPMVGGLSALFNRLCGLKFGGQQSPQPIIVDFTVTRSSLEQVFVAFAKHQIE